MNTCGMTIYLTYWSYVCGGKEKECRGGSRAEDSTLSVAWDPVEPEGGGELSGEFIPADIKYSLEVETHWVAETGREQQVRAEGEDKRGGMHVGKQKTRRL